MCRKPKRKEARAKSRNKSLPRAQSLQLSQRAMQARQQPTEKNENDKQQCNEDHHESMRCNVAHEEACKDVERVREPNDSNSGSTLENSRDWSHSSIFTIYPVLHLSIYNLLLFFERLFVYFVFYFSVLKRLVLKDKFVNVII